MANTDTGPSPSFELTPEMRFQAALARFQDHTETLRAVTAVDLQVIFGHMTLMLALAAWVFEHPLKTPSSKGSLLVLAIVVTFVAWRLLGLSNARRREVVASLTRVKVVLRFNAKDYYVKDSALDADATPRWWLSYYLQLAWVALIVCGVAILGIGRP